MHHLDRIGNSGIWLTLYRWDDVIQGNVYIGSDHSYKKTDDATVQWDSENDRCVLMLEDDGTLLSVEEFARRFLEPFLFPETWLNGGQHAP